jgi:hypothetical protein
MQSKHALATYGARFRTTEAASCNVVPGDEMRRVGDGTLDGDTWAAQQVDLAPQVWQALK